MFPNYNFHWSFSLSLWHMPRSHMKPLRGEPISFLISDIRDLDRVQSDNHDLARVQSYKCVINRVYTNKSGHGTLQSDNIGLGRWYIEDEINDQNFADEIFSFIFFMKIFVFWFVPNGIISNTLTSFQMIFWHRTGNKPLSDAMRT